MSLFGKKGVQLELLFIFDKVNRLRGGFYLEQG